MRWTGFKKRVGLTHPYCEVSWSAAHESSSACVPQTLAALLTLGCLYLLQSCLFFLWAINIKTQVRQLPFVVIELKFLQAEDNSCRESKWLTMSRWGTRLCTFSLSVIQFFTSVADTCLCAAWLSVPWPAWSAPLFMYILLVLAQIGVRVGLYVKEFKFRCLTTCTVCETSEPNPSHLLHKGMPS